MMTPRKRSYRDQWYGDRGAMAATAPSPSDPIPLRKPAPEPDTNSLVVEGLPAPDPSVNTEDNPDGSMTVTMGAAAKKKAPKGGAFDDNLVDDIPSIGSICSTLWERVRADFDAKEEANENYTKGMKLLGWDRRQDERSTPWPGAAGVISPTFGMACVDYQSRMVSELLPAAGPVRCAVLGHDTPEKQEKADRVAKFMNHQLMTQMEDYRTEHEVMLLQQPIAGTGIKVVYQDVIENRPRSDYVPFEDFAAPYGTIDLARAVRYTRVIHVHESVFDERVDAGMYREFTDAAMQPSGGNAKDTADRIEGVSWQLFGEDWYELFEVALNLEAWGDPEADDEKPAPYLVTLSTVSGQPVAVRRNWKQGDAERKARQAIVIYPFIPWRGIYAVGLTHLLGGMGLAATGALRALLDSAHASNAPGGYRAKGVGTSAAVKQYAPGTFEEIDMMGLDDIRKAMMPFPSNGPNSTLFELLGFLTDGMGKFAAATSEVTADANANAPVGTTLALIEEGTRQFAAIFQRQHNAMARELRLIAALNAEYLEDSQAIEIEGGELIISRHDFSDDISILPTSDPNVWSQTQRMARDQAVLQLSTQAPQLYDQRAIHKMLLVDMGVDDIDTIMPMPAQAKPQDPVSDLMTMAGGGPVAAFPGQAHMAYVQYFMAIASNPQYQPLLGTIGPALKAVVQQHLVLQAQQDAAAAFMQVTGHPMPPPGTPVPPQVQAMVAQVAARQAQQASAILQQQAQAQASPAGSPSAPGTGIDAAAMADVQRKAQADKADAQNDATKTMVDAKVKMAQIQQDATDSEKDRMVRLGVAMITATKGAEMTSATEPEIGTVDPTHAPMPAPPETPNG